MSEVIEPSKLGIEPEDEETEKDLGLGDLLRGRFDFLDIDSVQAVRDTRRET